MQKTKEYQEKMEEVKKLQKDAIQERIEKETYSDCLTHLEDKGGSILEGILISFRSSIRLKPNFSWKKTFESELHAKSAFPALEWTQKVDEVYIHEVHFQKLVFRENLALIKNDYLNFPAIIKLKWPA